MKRERSNGMKPHIRVGGGLIVGLLALGTSGQSGWAVTFDTMTGAPVQMQPYVSEPGAPIVTVTPGTSQPFSGLGSGSVGSGGTGTNAPSDALNTLLGQSSGAAIVANAQSLGVNGSAIASTCVLESGCQALSGGSGAQGMFQMYPAAFQEGITTALAINPALASQIVQGPGGVNDPVTAGIAASGYLMQANSTLQAAGVSNPTVLDGRAYYQFGPTYGSQVAIAPPDQLMANLMPPSFLTSNNIPVTQTVAQWQAGVAAKIGNAATQPILG